MKTLIICCYIAHKVWWKRNHAERKVSWEKFFEVGVNKGPLS
jgi:hypothetical protein